MARAHAFNPDEQAKLSGKFVDYYINSSVPSDRIWRPAEGVTHLFRILPPWSPRGALALEIPRYYQKGLQQLSFVSPNFFGERDPFLDTRKMMRKLFNDNKHTDAYKDFSWDVRKAVSQLNKDFLWDWEQAKSTDSLLYNVVVLTNDVEKSKGPQVWQAGYFFFTPINNIVDSGLYGYIADEETGRNLTMKITKVPLPDGKSKNSPTILATGNSSKLENLDWCENLFDLDTVVRKPNLDDVWACYETIPWKFITPVQREGTATPTIKTSQVAEKIEDDVPTIWSDRGDTIYTPVIPPTTTYSIPNTYTQAVTYSKDTSLSDRAAEAKRIQEELKAARAAEKANK